MKAAFPISLFCAALLTSAPLQAQEIDPGMWQMEQQFEPGAGGQGGGLAQQMLQMQAELKNMPPAARKMMEEQMARMGMNISLDGGMKVTLRNCISAEDAARGVIREGQQEGDCTFTKVNRQGSTVQGEVVCSGKEMNGSGRFTTTVHDRRHFSTTAEINSREMGPLKMNSEARYLSAEYNGSGILGGAAR